MTTVSHPETQVTLTCLLPSTTIKQNFFQTGRLPKEDFKNILTILMSISPAAIHIRDLHKDHLMRNDRVAKCDTVRSVHAYSMLGMT